MAGDALQRLEWLDEQILRALDDPAAELPDELISERGGMLRSCFSGDLDESDRYALEQAMQRQQRIEQLTRLRREAVGRALEDLHFSHRAVGAYIDNQ